MVSDRSHHFHDLRDLTLGHHVDLHVDTGPAVTRPRCSVLADEDEDREEDRFQRYDHGQKAEGKGVELERGRGQIEHDPDAEPDGVRSHEGYAPAPFSYGCRRTLSATPLAALLRL